MSAMVASKNGLVEQTSLVPYLKSLLLLVGLMLCFSLVFSFVVVVQPSAMLANASQEAPAVALVEAVDADALVAPLAVSPMLSPQMQAALDYVKRRYRVSQDALLPVFQTAEIVGKERRIDPLLIVAIIGIESRFNPFAESHMGAQGLMQVMPRFHLDKLPKDAGDNPFFDPLLNIKVGAHVLEEAIKRQGGLVAGLQSYAGSSSPTNGYADKVLAEKERIEQAVRRDLAT